MSIPVLKIKKEEDLNLLDEDGNYHLEIYLPEIVVLVRELQGSLKIRAVNCWFPYLREVKGDVSIDAKGSELSELKIVHGELNIHEEEIELPSLEIVIGQIKVLAPIKLDKLSIINKKIEIKSEDVYINENVQIISKKKFIQIKNQSDVERISNIQFENIRIQKNINTLSKVINIDVTHFYGSIEIIDMNCSFNNLEKIYGSLIVRNNDKTIINTPKLETIQENCIVNSSNQTINVSHIKGKLFIEEGIGNRFPKLETIGKLNISRDGSELIADNLIEIKRKTFIAGCLKSKSIEFSSKKSHLPYPVDIKGSFKLSDFDRKFSK
ncbi:hypothetical protein [Tenacibaculum sp. M341]|uniref:hypothetical protein n=1 Tax=Tenacibaculum sp. M341 TaxID=2530339 RepID=UPI00104D3060|nr:hypothetical protein [Tenacibaculum sp. M341]TCI91149.1 hypothetical protein EYW44_12495 [Tenacibaculum sp. M341]